MPFGISKSGSKYKVINKHSKRVLGTHGSKEAAKKQLTAVQINYYKEESKPFGIVSVNVNDEIGNYSNYLQNQLERLADAIRTLDFDPDARINSAVRGRKVGETIFFFLLSKMVTKAEAKGIPFQYNSEEFKKNLIGFLNEIKQEALEMSDYDLSFIQQMEDNEFSTQIHARISEALQKREFGAAIFLMACYSVRKKTLDDVMGSGPESIDIAP